MEKLVILARSPLFGGFLRIELIRDGGRGSLSGSGHSGEATIFLISSHKYKKSYSMFYSRINLCPL